MKRGAWPFIPKPLVLISHFKKWILAAHDNGALSIFKFNL